MREWVNQIVADGDYDDDEYGNDDDNTDGNSDADVGDGDDGDADDVIDGGEDYGNDDGDGGDDDRDYVGINSDNSVNQDDDDYDNDDDKRMAAAVTTKGGMMAMFIRTLIRTTAQLAGSQMAMTKSPIKEDLARSNAVCTDESRTPLTKIFPTENRGYAAYGKPHAVEHLAHVVQYATYTQISIQNRHNIAHRLDTV